MISHILVGSDLSERSDRAVDRAVDLAKRFSAQLTVLHVVDEDIPSSIADHQKIAATKHLAELVGSVAATGGPRISPVVEFGKDWTEILRQSEILQADLIVLGIHRESRLAGLFRGTTVERVVRNSAVPVLTVRNKPTRDYHTIVVGVDFSIYSRRALDFALSFAPSAEVHLVHAYDVPFKSFLTGSAQKGELNKRQQKQFSEAIDEEMTSFLAGSEPHLTRIRTVIREGDPNEVLRSYVSEKDANLMVLGTHGRTGLARAMLGSTAETFFTDPPCDVVAIKAW